MTSKKPSKKNYKQYFTLLHTVSGMSEFTLKQNGLRVLFYRIADTNVITSNIVYRVGSRDEMPGCTGLAHMLEHMLFKPTKQDIARKSDSGAMTFEREVGVLLNATTWRERTNYYFSYPKEHVTRALTIEAERMHDVVLSDTEFLPERTNVLSEFDMYNGQPEFALEKTVTAAALVSHPYGHEVIGFREDIEAYTVVKLQSFYETHYAPNNATLIIVGDITEADMFREVYEIFSHLPAKTITPRLPIIEPAQEGKRLVVVERPTTTNIVAIASKHPGFPSLGWNETLVLYKILADGPDSILHRALVDSGRAASVRFSIEPNSETSVGTIFITLSGNETHTAIETDTLQIIADVSVDVLQTELQKTVAQIVDGEAFERDSSFKIAGDLTEYVAAGNWPAYFETKQTLKKINGKNLYKRKELLFTPKTLTVGHFIGTTK